MSRNRKKVLLGVCVAAVVSLTGASSRPVESFESREVTRLRGHFAVVLRELRAADVSRLSPSQRTARAVLISRLEGYAAAGRFPHNHVVAGRVPVFRDGHGTLCAMGFLIASTGRADIVGDVAGRRNLAYIPELADDIRLQRWLDSTGLTVAEAARIQPQYCNFNCTPAPAQPSSAPSREYLAGSMLASAVSGASILMNVVPRSMSAKSVRRYAILGALFGAGQIALGTSHMHKDGAAGTIGLANAGIGAASLAAGVWRLRHLPQPSVAIRSVSVLPFVSPDGRAAGILFSARR